MKLFIFVVVALMLSGIAMAAEVPTSAGDKAMIFMFNGFDDLSLGGYGEYGIGMRYYIADGTAIRGGLMFSNYSYTDESDVPGAADSEVTESMYGIELVYEKHLEGPCASVSPYVGVGGTFMSMSTEYSNWGEWWYDEYWDEWYWDGVADQTVNGTGYGIFGVLGFEWAFTGCMTLGGEYQLGYFGASGDTDVPETTPARETCCKWSESWTGFDTASVYLSVYW